VCPYAYLAGRVVTLTALPSDDPGSVPFSHWSDDDCGVAPTCAVVLDEPRTSVTGTFGTQHVFVQVWGPGHVTSTPAGIDCTVTEADGFDECSTVVATGEDVALTAEGVNPQWKKDPAPERAGCDFTTGTADTVCHVIAERSRWTVVSFAGVPAQDQYPPKAGVNFKVRKAGDGHGTVRGGGIDCGSRCKVEASFGDRVVLSADAAAGSRFVRWRGGCGERARCELTVGPTTRVTAVFARVAAAATVQPKPKVEKLRAALQRVRVKRVRGRRYRIVMPLRLNLAAKVTARVMSRRGRRLVRRAWRAPAGNRQLILRVRARNGRYRIIVRIQTADGQVRRITRTLRLR
jgi:Divergent InlB B-repeat domain